MKVPGVLIMIKDAVWNFFEDDAITLAGSVAYFTALSLAPLLVLMLSVAGLFSETAHKGLVSELESLLGPRAGDVIEVVLENVEKEELAGRISAVLGLAVLLFSATAVFAQLQKSMNQIWGVQAVPGREIKEWFRKRLLSLGMVLGVGFLLLVSLVITAALNLLFRGTEVPWRLINFAASLLIYVLLFGGMFVYVPDVKLAWKDIGVGALITAFLFTAGKWAIGQYIGYSGVGSSYGAAGTLVVLLVWVYFSCLIVFFGAELAKAYTMRYGSKIMPKAAAVWAEEVVLASYREREKQIQRDEEERKKDVQKSS